MIFGMSVYQMLWYFLIYSFLGWVIEVIFHAVVLGKILNRGFLNGPVCPIYGFGVISVFALAAFTGYSQEALDTVPIWLMFVGGSLLATGVELIGGFILDMCFHARWWDYSDKPFNLHGYICLEFSLLWGLSIAFVLRVIHPHIHATTVGLIPEGIGYPILAVIYLVYLIDVVVTVLTVTRLNRYLRELDDLQKKLRVVSNTLTDAIGTGTYVTMNTIDRSREKADLASKRLRESVSNAGTQLESSVRTLQQGIGSAMESGREYLDAKRGEVVDAILEERTFGMGRLLRVHPAMKHREYPELVARLQKVLDTEKADQNPEADGSETNT